MHVSMHVCLTQGSMSYRLIEVKICCVSVDVLIEVSLCSSVSVVLAKQCSRHQE